ncbi:MAG: hypothetical protein FK733_12600, partial [Asgard group archaeon]|nr:hypothetical protein [Asgard group archaeon]
MVKRNFLFYFSISMLVISLSIPGIFHTNSFRSNQISNYTTYIANYFDLVTASEPTGNISLLGEWDITTGKYYDIDIVGDLAYIAAGAAGLVVLNISDIYNPVFVGDFYGYHQEVRDVQVQDNYAYLAQ